MGLSCLPRLVHVVSGVPSAKIHHNHIVLGEGLELSHAIIPEGEVESPVSPAYAVYRP